MKLRLEFVLIFFVQVNLLFVAIDSVKQSLTAQNAIAVIGGLFIVVWLSKKVVTHNDRPNDYNVIYSKDSKLCVLHSWKLLKTEPNISYSQCRCCGARKVVQPNLEINKVCWAWVYGETDTL